MKKVFLPAIALITAIFVCAASIPVSAAFIPVFGGERVTVIARTDGVDPVKAAAAASALSGGRVKIKYIYDTLITGFAAEIDATEYDALASLPVISSLAEEGVYARVADEEETAGDTLTDKAVISLRADKTYDGTGTLIAVIDNGFDVKHGVFKLTSISSAALSKADVIALHTELHAAVSAYVSPKIPFAYDYNGGDTNVKASNLHGTAIAGIAAGNGSNYLGAAPEAQLLLMKVFNDDNDEALESDIIAALEDAVKLGADVINLSLGSGIGSASGAPLDSSVGDAITAAYNAGVTVTGAAGNDGHIGDSSENYYRYEAALPSATVIDYGTVNSPASVSETIAVANRNADAEYRYSVLFGTDKYVTYTDTCENYTNYGNKAFTALLGDKTYDYVAVPGLGTKEDFDSLSRELDGCIALVKRGDITFVTKVNNAYDAGAAGVIIWDNVENNTQIVNMDLAGALIPAILISFEDGSELAAAGSGRVTIKNGMLGRFELADSGTLSDSSSWGVTPSFELKPELTAAGENTYAPAPDNKFVMISGTSMASAAAAGSAAALTQYLRRSGTDYDAASVKRLLMNSCETLADRDSGVFYSPRVQGAGSIDIGAAVKTRTSLTSSETGEAKYSNMSITGAEAEIKLSITNNSDADREYIISTAVQSDAYRKFTNDNGYSEYIDLCLPRAFDGAAAIVNGVETNSYSGAYKGAAITVAAGKTVEFTLKLKLDAVTAKEYSEIFTNGYYLEGYVFAECEGDRAVLPYVLFAGSWDEVPLFDDTAYGADFGSASYYYNSAFMGDSTVLPYQIILGMNQYSDDPNCYTGSIAFSPNGDGELDSFDMTFDLLRCARDITGGVYSESGELVADMGELSYQSKTFVHDGVLLDLSFLVWDGSSDENEYYIFPDGNYTLVLYAYPAFEGSSQQKLAISFRVDTKKPEITSCRIENSADGSQTLVVGVKDDTALQSGLMYLTGKGFKKNDYIVAVTDGTAKTDVYSFDITGWEDSGADHVYLDIYDYAMNCLVYRVDLAALSEIAGGK